MMVKKFKYHIKRKISFCFMYIFALKCREYTVNEFDFQSMPVSPQAFRSETFGHLMTKLFTY